MGRYVPYTTGPTELTRVERVFFPIILIGLLIRFGEQRLFEDLGL
jgi:hypothetical protein